MRVQVHFIERRIAAIDEAMASLPLVLRPKSWSYQWLTGPNGIRLEADARSWGDNSAPFEASCEGREAQVVYSLPAADGVLEVVNYYKWGCWNLNLWWREQADVTPETVVAEADDDVVEDMETALKNLQAKFND